VLTWKPCTSFLWAFNLRNLGSCRLWSKHHSTFLQSLIKLTFLPCIYSGGGNKNTKPEFSRINGGGSMSDMSICCMDLDMSSTENGILESSSSRNELLTGLLESSVINTLMFDITSGETLCVPYLSSQYIVLILYSCCILSTGQRS